MDEHGFFVWIDGALRFVRGGNIIGFVVCETGRRFTNVQRWKNNEKKRKKNEKMSKNNEEYEKIWKNMKKYEKMWRNMKKYEKKG